MTDRTPNWSKAEIVSRDTSTQWLTDSEILNQLNLVGDTSQITMLREYDLVVRTYIEEYLGSAVFAQTWTGWYRLDSTAPAPFYLDLPTTPRPVSTAVTINTVKAYTAASGLVTLDSSLYTYDSTGNRVVLNSVPALSDTVANPVVVTFTLAESPLATNPAVLHAGKMLLTHLYNNRDTHSEKVQNEVPMGFSALLRPYKPLVM